MATERKASRQQHSQYLHSNIVSNHHEDKQTTENPRDFLYRSGANNLICKALSSVIQNRPEDPIAFLVEYFGGIVDTKTPLQQAYQKVTLTHYSQPVFESNIVNAYQLFRIDKKSGLRGLQGSIFNDLLTLLMTSPSQQNTAATSTERIMKQVLVGEEQAVSFQTFRTGILTILIYKDYVSVAESLYNDIDFSGRGKADGHLCEFLLDQLNVSLDQRHFVSDNHPYAPEYHSSLKGEELGIKLLELIVEDEFSNSKWIMKQEDFVEKMIEIFLSNLT